MEYVQMTLDDWVQMKQRLKQELLGVKQSFVRIGYALRKIDDQRLYEQDGYKSVAEFAKGEYGLEPSTTSRFMAINREYSIDGYSEHLRPEYADLGRSQLEEMLKLPEGDRSMIQPEASRQSIRDLKAFNRSEPEQGEADDLRQLVEAYFRINKEELREYLANREEGPGDEKLLKEIVNPSGNKSFRKGMFFLMMYENNIQVKKFGESPREMSWEEFHKWTEEACEKLESEMQEEEKDGPEEAGGDSEGVHGSETGKGASKADGAEIPSAEGGNREAERGGDTEESTGGAAVTGGEDAENREADPELEENAEGDEQGAEAEGREIAPAQEPEELKESELLEVLEEPEETEKVFGSRKQFIDRLTAAGAATYLFEKMSPSHLIHLTELVKWMEEPVYTNGNELKSSAGGEE